ncbi:phosphatase PAP2 family protein [Sphingomonas quercus]|uniref:Phosphatase PAP2 family protein n=1 Tax=Sphingomonas quercus TaxID=2842451 RepID=A0ABS6BMK5_9SPHN|nr:phosphatase PAP2 family protein [Sphingomonas quercus]MBU3078430.1 phosphatase PAP2 family protein [Sphingomonas quercus]
MLKPVRRGEPGGAVARAIGGGVLLLLGAVLIGLAIAAGWTDGLDRAGLSALSNGPAGFWLIWTRLADSHVRIPVAILAVALLVARRDRFAAAGLLVTVGGALGLNALAKDLVARPRPTLFPHGDPVDGFSFPSGHSEGAAALALGLALYLAPPRWRGWAVAAALLFMTLVGLSRVALGVHWPSDVLAGWCEGAGFALIVRATLSVITRWARLRRAG